MGRENIQARMNLPANLLSWKDFKKAYFGKSLQASVKKHKLSR